MNLKALAVFKDNKWNLNLLILKKCKENIINLTEKRVRRKFTK